MPLKHLPVAVFSDEPITPNDLPARWRRRLRIKLVDGYYLGGASLKKAIGLFLFWYPSGPEYAVARQPSSDEVAAKLTSGDLNAAAT